VTIDATNQNGAGNVVVKNKEGTTVIGGDQTATAPPAWCLPIPVSRTKTGGMRSEKGDKVSGGFISETQDAPAKVKEFYESKLKAAATRRKSPATPAARARSTP